jgi:hypothetical protein
MTSTPHVDAAVVEPERETAPPDNGGLMTLATMARFRMQARPAKGSPVTSPLSAVGFRSHQADEFCRRDQSMGA